MVAEDGFRAALELPPCRAVAVGELRLSVRSPPAITVPGSPAMSCAVCTAPVVLHAEMSPPLSSTLSPVGGGPVVMTSIGAYVPDSRLS